MAGKGRLVGGRRPVSVVVSYAPLPVVSTSSLEVQPAAGTVPQPASAPTASTSGAIPLLGTLPSAAAALAQRKARFKRSIAAGSTCSGAAAAAVAAGLSSQPVSKVDSGAPCPTSAAAGARGGGLVLLGCNQEAGGRAAAAATAFRGQRPRHALDYAACPVPLAAGGQDLAGYPTGADAAHLPPAPVATLCRERGISAVKTVSDGAACGAGASEAALGGQPASAGMRRRARGRQRAPTVAAVVTAVSHSHSQARKGSPIGPPSTSPSQDVAASLQHLPTALPAAATQLAAAAPQSTAATQLTVVAAHSSSLDGPTGMPMVSPSAVTSSQRTPLGGLHNLTCAAKGYKEGGDAVSSGSDSSSGVQQHRAQPAEQLQVQRGGGQRRPRHRRGRGGAVSAVRVPPLRDRPLVAPRLHEWAWAEDGSATVRNDALLHMCCPVSGRTAAEECACGWCARVLELALVADCMAARLAHAKAEGMVEVVFGHTASGDDVGAPVLALSMCEGLGAERLAFARRELYRTVGFCPPVLSRQLSEPHEVGWVCAAAQTGLDLVAAHERGSVYDEEFGVLWEGWRDVLEDAMAEVLGVPWWEEQWGWDCEEEDDNGVYSDGW